MIDYQGIALVIGACAALISAIGGVVMQYAALKGQRKLMAVSKEIHEGVNGQTRLLVETAKAASLAEGHAAGVADERADPHVSVSRAD